MAEASPKLSAKDSLPAVCRDRGKHHLRHPSPDDLASFIADDLSTSQLEALHRSLWMVGKPYPPRPLNLQRVLSRAAVATDDISLHLVWTAHKIFVKPLPSCILADDFYDEFLQPTQLSQSDSTSKTAARNSLGFLYSYLALVQTELDFALAHEAHLFPSGYEWRHWKQLAEKILKAYEEKDIYKHIPRRYIYGELRLGRLNKISRFLQGDIVHGYSVLTSTTRYVDFFTENLTVIGAATVYVVVVLAAMQVGLETNALGQNSMFQDACHGFSIFAIMAPVIVLGSLVLVFFLLFFSNWAQTIRRRHQRSIDIDMNPKALTGAEHI